MHQQVADPAEDDAAVRAAELQPDEVPLRFSSRSPAVLTVLGLALFLHRGEAALNVDFRGGTVFAGKLKEGEERGLITTDRRQARLPRALERGESEEAAHADVVQSGEQAERRSEAAVGHGHLRLRPSPTPTTPRRP